jgi:hypothetical protein
MSTQQLPPEQMQALEQIAASPGLLVEAYNIDLTILYELEKQGLIQGSGLVNASITRRVFVGHPGKQLLKQQNP